MPLTISPGADEALAMLRDQVEDLPEGGGVRITAETDEQGESGFSLGMADGPAEGDHTVEGHNLPVFVEAAAATMLDAMVLDGEVHGDHVHFGFTPQGDEGTAA
jgi:Fe-S cluster assembly iron-binding protein IscA